MPDLRAAQRNAEWAARMREIQKKRGMAGRNQLWTEEEDATCRRLYPDYKAIHKSLPHRSLRAVRGRGQKLGLAPKRNLITAAELSKLRRLYPTATRSELRSAFPQRSVGAIERLARYYRIWKRTKPLKPTGHALIDAIRARCHELNYSMVDLDDIAGTGKYFASARWCGAKKVAAAHVVRAVAALDGQLSVEWSRLQ